MMHSFQKQISTVYSILLSICISLLLSACSSGESTITTQSENQDGVPIPSVISAALPTDGTLSAYIRIDGGLRQAMTIAGDTASITLSGVSLGQHTITMEFEFVLKSNPDQPLMLASASQTMNVVAGENPPLTFANYDTESFDADGDGISNLAELSNNTNPIAGIVVSPASGNTSEDGTTATFTVVLSSQPTADVVIGISSSDPTEGTVNIDAITFNTTNWDTSQTITVTGVNDSFDDGDQNYHINFTAAVSNDNDFNGLQSPSLNLINLDNDTSGVQPPEVTLSINTSSPLAENGGSANLTASLSAVSEVPVTVNLLYSGTATPGTDYTKSDSIVIPAGNTLAQVAITAVDDAEDESNETIIVDIDSVIDGFEVTAQQVTASIADDDVPVVNFSNPAQTVSEIVGGVSMSVALDQPGVLDINVPYTVSGTATGGGADHDLSSGMLTIPAGQTGTQITFSVIDDTGIEPNETVVVTLGAPTNATLGTGIVHTVTIVSNDYSVSGTVTGYTGTELVLQNNNTNNLPVSGTTFTFTATVADGSSYNVTVLTQPPGQFCNINNAFGTIAGANVINVEVNCQDIVLNVSSSKPKTLTFSWSTFPTVTSYRLLVNPDGSSGYTPVGADTTETSLDVEIPVHLTDWINSTYILEAYIGTTLVSSSDPVSIIGTMISSIGYFKASNTDAKDYFGSSIALSSDGNYLAVGVRSESSNATGVNCNGINVGDTNSNGIPDCQEDNSRYHSGAVYVFSRNGNTWTQQAYLKASNAGVSDYFGYSVSLSENGNTLAVGANYEYSNATGVNCNGNIDDTNGNGIPDCQEDNSIDASGAVYVFTRSANSWSQQAYIKASNPGLTDLFGSSVALSTDGNTLAVGAYGEDSSATGISTDGSGEGDNNASSSGAVYVFSQDANGWSQQAYIKASNTGASDGFGTVTLSTDGNTLAVAANRESSNVRGVNCNGNLDDTNGNGIPDCQEDDSQLNSGAVYVFTRSGITWTQQAYVKASNTEADDQFGASVALSSDGGTLAVGASYEDSNTIGISSDGTGESDNNAANAGAVYVFSRDTNGWNQQVYVKASNTGASDYFGGSVALSADGNTLAAGTLYESSNATGVNCNGNTADNNGNGIPDCQEDNSIGSSGAVYVFTRNADSWSQQAYVKAPNPGTIDVFGRPVALSVDGNTMAVGAIFEDSNATDINGNPVDDCGAATPSNCATDSGAVYLY